MPFGLCHAPTTFMHLINDVLHPFIDSFVIVYLDYTFVYSATWEDNISHLKQVLETLKKINCWKTSRNVNSVSNTWCILGM